jgi:Flp pilus assembly protein TadD
MKNSAIGRSRSWRLQAAIMLLFLGGSLAGANITDQQLEQGRASAFDLMNVGQYEEAERRFRVLLRHRPDDTQTRFGLGTLYIQSGAYVQAIEILESLLAENPEHYMVLNNLAWLYATNTDYRLRNGPRAVELAQEALFIQPHDFHLWNTLSAAYYTVGEYEMSVRAAEEALRHGRRRGASSGQLRQYEEQLDKSRIALEANTLLK